MAVSNLPANSTPPDTPKPGPLSLPGAVDPLAWTPNPSVLQQPGAVLIAVNACPMPAGPVRIQPTTPNQDYASQPFPPGQDPSGQST